jgi:hypothetical protein
MEDFELEKFSDEDYELYYKHFNDDKEMEEEATLGERKDLEDKFTFELSPANLPNVSLVNIKEMPYDDKVRFLRLCFNCDCIDNACIITNLVILAQGRLIEEELYKNDDVFFNDDLEFLDACTDLRDEIANFNSKIVTYFLGALKSQANYLDDGAVHAPNIYYLALASYNIESISSAMQKATLDYQEVPYVMNSSEIVERILLKKNFVNDFMSNLLETISEGA